MRAYTCRDAYVEDRGQLSGVRSLCLPCGPQVIRLGGKHFYLRSHAIEFLLPVSPPKREKKKKEGRKTSRQGSFCRVKTTKLMYTAMALTATWVSVSYQVRVIGSQWSEDQRRLIIKNLTHHKSVSHRVSNSEVMHKVSRGSKCLRSDPR